MADLVIVAIVLLGAIVGFRRGFAVPLVAQGGALLTLAALYAGPLTGALPSGTAGLGAGVAALFVGGVGLQHGWLDGHRDRPQAVAARALRQGPGDPAGHGDRRGIALRCATFAAFADPAMLKLLAQSAAKAPIPSDHLAQFDGALAFYELTIRPELLQSKIAPALLLIGENLPFIGRPATLPAR